VTASAQLISNKANLHIVSVVELGHDGQSVSCTDVAVFMPRDMTRLPSGAELARIAGVSYEKGRHMVMLRGPIAIRALEEPVVLVTEETAATVVRSIAAGKLTPAAGVRVLQESTRTGSSGLSSVWRSSRSNPGAEEPEQ
jgi:hypothetical protein